MKFKKSQIVLVDVCVPGYDDKGVVSFDNIQQTGVYAVNIHEKGRYILVEDIKNALTYVKIVNAVNKDGIIVCERRVLLDHMLDMKGHFDDKYVSNVKPAFDESEKDEKISLKELKKLNMQSVSKEELTHSV